MNVLKSILFIVLVFCFCNIFAKDQHVSKQGKDANDGSEKFPFKTIQKAAMFAYPGDVITVHEGVYRERIASPRGGISEKEPIVYRAAPGERVVISGAEIVTGWEKVENDTWKLTLPNTFFGETNPFDEQIYGSWYFSQNIPNHTGFVVLDGKRLREVFSLEQILKPIEGKPRWYAEADGNGGPILMNLEWIQPVGGERKLSAQASVEEGDQAIDIKNWAFGYLKDSSVMHFGEVDFGEGTDTLRFQAATLAKGGTVEMYLEDSSNELLGSSVVTNTGDWKNFSIFNLKMKYKLSGNRNIRLVLKAPEIPTNGQTTIWAQFPNGIDPNKGSVEVTVRPQVFYPNRTGINYITVSGFIMENAATNWAPPSAEQPGLIGPRWAKGWIIENNVIRNSRCSGISLGRSTFGHAHHYQSLPPRVYPEKNGGQTEQQLLDYFENASWDKEEAGFHIVRNNHIYECGQTGIVGCSGASFSLVEGNEIHDICIGESFKGYEMAGIKFHFAIDLVLKNNHIYHTNRGMWLDWGMQGVQVINNLFHDNNQDEDIFVEVCHGPILFANNILLSNTSLLLSQGMSFAHNLISGKVVARPDERLTYYYKPHETVSAGKVNNMGGDLQWLNNHLVNSASLGEWKKLLLPVQYDGNLFSSGAHAASTDTSAFVDSVFHSDVKLVEKADGWYLSMNVSSEWRKSQKHKLVTSDVLEKTIIPQQKFTNPDGSDLMIKTDYFGNKRKQSNPYAGPIEIKKSGWQEWKVWPKNF